MSKNTQPKCTMEFKCLFHNNKIVKALTLFWGWDYHYCLCLLEKQSLKDTGQNIEFTIGFLVDKGRQTNDNVLQQNKQPHHLKKKKRKENIRKVFWHQIQFYHHTNRSITSSTYHLIPGNDLGCQKQSWRKCCSRWTSSFYQGKEKDQTSFLIQRKQILLTRSELLQKNYATSQNIVYCHVKFQWQETKKFETASGKNNNYYNLTVLL